MDVEADLDGVAGGVLVIPPHGHTRPLVRLAYWLRSAWYSVSSWDYVGNNS